VEAGSVSRQRLGTRWVRVQNLPVSKIQKDILSTIYLKDATDPTWKDDPALKEWASSWTSISLRGIKLVNFSVYGYFDSGRPWFSAQAVGDTLTRENVMRQAANLKNFEPGLLLPGIKINTSPTDYYPLEQMQMSGSTVSMA